MICHYCDECTAISFIDHEAIIKEKCPDFSIDDYTCTVCLSLLYQPMTTDSAIYNTVCRACLVQIPMNDHSPTVAVANVPLRNQLNIFLRKAGYKEDDSVCVTTPPYIFSSFDDVLNRRRPIAGARARVHAMRAAVAEFQQFLNGV